MREESNRPGTATADFVVVAYQEDGRWSAERLPARSGDRLDTLLAGVRGLRGEGTTIGLVSVDDDIFVVVRLDPSGGTRLFISDATAAVELAIARDVLDALGEPVPGEDDLDAPRPAGDAEIFADLGLDSWELGALCRDLDDDFDLYPEDVLSGIAARLGFGRPFDTARSRQT